MVKVNVPGLPINKDVDTKFSIVTIVSGYWIGKEKTGVCPSIVYGPF
jgi:hypothetical protein